MQRIAFGILGTGLVILVLAGIAFRDPLLEQWHLHRLDSTDEETVAAAVHALGDVGSQRSVPRLLELAQPDSPLLDESVQTLGRICPRLGRAARSPLLEGLVALVRGNDPTAVEVLLRLAPDTPDLFPIVFRALESSPPPAVRSSIPLRDKLQVWNITSGMTVASFPSRCASLVVAGWPESRAATAAFLSAKRLELASVFIPYLQTRFRAGLSPTDPETVSEILRHFAREHPEAEIRALCLAPAATTVDRSGDEKVDFTFLREAFGAEESLLVRRAVVRLATLVGSHPENLDLSKLLFRTREPLLLTDIVRAMTLLATESSQVSGVELFEGLECDWIGPAGRATRARPWSQTEIDAAAALLESRKEPELRDALSAALAEPWRSASETQLATKGDFAVHEWGVWKEQSTSRVPRPAKGRMAPAGPTLADLPPFVHRSRVSARTLGGARHDPNASIVIYEVLKPVVFFYASRPQVVFLQVEFHHGRPWTFYPQPTDYTQKAISSAAGGIPRAARPLRVVPGVISVGDRELPEVTRLDETTYALAGGLMRVAPPWLDPQGTELSAETRAELTGRYRVAPWRVPRSPYVAPQRKGRNTNPPFTVSEVGLEWCGLRIGFPAELEASRPEADSDSWWSFLREVPSTPIAIRGESEDFLFYDGAVPLQPPLSVFWSDEGLSVRVRAFSDKGSTDPWQVDPTSPPGVLATIPACFVVHVSADTPVRGTVLRALAPSAQPHRVAFPEMELEGPEVRERFEETLREQGLTAAEARSLTRTWNAEFFQTPGTRLLTFIPRRLYDTLLPMKIRPPPRELVRVGVVWKELE